MDDGQALLAEIAAEPDDNATRLVYADWLDEHGRPEYAEFIRVQIELAVTRQEVAAIPIDLSDHEKSLFRWIARHQTFPFTRTPCLAEFDRGFVARTYSSVSEVAGVLYRLTTAAPLREVIFLTASPGIEMFTDAEDDDPDQYAISLQEEHRIGPGGPESLAGIRSLVVIGTETEVPDVALERIAARGQPIGKPLAFRFSRCPLGESGARCLAESAVFQSLTEVTVAGDLRNLTRSTLAALRARYNERLTTTAP